MYFAVVIEGLLKPHQNGVSYESKEILVFTTEAKASAYAEKISKTHAGTDIHVCRSVSITHAEVSKISRRVVNDKGEVLPA